MVHRHASHTHNRPLEARDPDNNKNVVIVYKTLDSDSDGDDHMTQGNDKSNPDTATKENNKVGLGPPVLATPTDEPEQKTTEEVRTKENPTEAMETTEKAHAMHKGANETSQTEKPKAGPTKATLSETDASTTTEARPDPTANSFMTSVIPTADSSHEAKQLEATSNPTITNSAASASSTAPGTQSEGISSGAKAGIAIGVILGVGVIAALVFLFVRRKKRNQTTEEVEDEKFFGTQNLPPLPVSKPARISTPPQLKVRPITQFAPDLSTSGGINSTAGLAAGSAVVASRDQTEETPPLASPKSAASNPFNDPVNPFSPVTTPATEQPPAPVSGAGPLGLSTAAAGVGAAAAGAIGTTTAASSHQSDKEKSSYPISVDSDGRSPGQSSPSPVSVDGDSVTLSTMAAAGTAGLIGPGPINVYRVQMDFNPSMEDELALRTGSLVRMLHEYDDGWALCVRLDRSQQGVAPRSCLSARPVKPRARPSPVAIPGPRGPLRMGPMSPAGRIPSGPTAARFYPQESRPRSPGGQGYVRPPYPEQSMSPTHFPVVSGAGGPTIRQVPRSSSPAPYGAPRIQNPGMMYADQRQFSNGSGNVSPHIASVSSPKPGGPQTAAEPSAPRSDSPTIGDSIPSSPPIRQVESKFSPAQDR